MGGKKTAELNLGLDGIADLKNALQLLNKIDQKMEDVGSSTDKADASIKKTDESVKKTDKSSGSALTKMQGWATAGMALLGSLAVVNKALGMTDDYVKSIYDGFEKMKENYGAKMAIEGLVASGQISAEDNKTMMAVQGEARRGGLELNETDLLKATAALAPAAKTLGVSFERMLRATIGLSALTGGDESLFEMSEEIVAGAEGTLSDQLKKRSIFIDETKYDGMSDAYKRSHLAEDFLKAVEKQDFLGEALDPNDSKATALVGLLSMEASKENMLVNRAMGAADKTVLYEQWKNQQRYDLGYDPSNLTEAYNNSSFFAAPFFENAWFEWFEAKTRDPNSTFGQLYKYTPLGAIINSVVKIKNTADGAAE